MHNQRRKMSLQQRKCQTQDRLRKKLAQNKGAKKICLTMIVKNESQNMPRILDSVEPIIDMISIVDTGSTDKTKELILNWGKTHNIPTTVHEEPFKNFAYNRTHSIRMAKNTYKDADYFLLSDADFVWRINEGDIFDKSLLVDHKYLVLQFNKALSYWNIRLLSAKVDWECVGVTHEYWQETKQQTEYAGEIRTSKINTLKIDDKEDGGCKSDKFERDERLLKDGLVDALTPEHLKTRYTFYLAQTLKDMAKYKDSIEWYTKRIERKGWVEEIYYSKFQIGFCHEQLGWKYKHVIKILSKSDRSEEDMTFLKQWNNDNLLPSEMITQSTKAFENAAVNYMAAYNYRKTRAEALYYLSRMYRTLSQNKKAFELAIEGKKIKYPEDTLFIEDACYDYLFDVEIFITAFYLESKKHLGREACSRLIKHEKLPENIRNLVEQQAHHYL
jgi:glycosyltransferase involved in cell wall biosynthesis